MVLARALFGRGIIGHSIVEYVRLFFSAYSVLKTDCKGTPRWVSYKQSLKKHGGNTQNQHGEVEFRAEAILKLALAQLLLPHKSDSLRSAFYAQRVVALRQLSD
jgi:hypothetical protein